MKVIRRSLVLLVAACALSATAFASERGSRDEAKALCNIVIDHIKKVGFDKAGQDLGAETANWSPRDLEVFVHDYSGVLRQYRASRVTDKNLLDVKDSSGKDFAKEMIATAERKCGFIEYEW